MNNYIDLDDFNIMQIFLGLFFLSPSSTGNGNLIHFFSYLLHFTEHTHTHTILEPVCSALKFTFAFPQFQMSQIPHLKKNNVFNSLSVFQH